MAVELVCPALGRGTPSPLFPTLVHSPPQLGTLNSNQPTNQPELQCIGIAENEPKATRHPEASETLLDSGMNFAATPEKIELVLVRALPDSTEVVWVHELAVLP